MLPYLIHVSLLTAVCYLVYYILLHRETFYQFNRWFLLGSLILAFSVPLLEIPQEWSLRKVGTTEMKTSIAPKVKATPINKERSITKNNNTITSSIQAKNKIVKKDISTKVVDSTPIPNKTSRLSITTILFYLYLSGLVILLINFLIQLFSLSTLIFKNKSLRDGRFKIVSLTDDIAPFSFMNYIFINPSKYDLETYNQILDHEKIHIQGHHSLDILLMEWLTIVLWFNPFAWMYRKAVEHNLEFLTDQTMLKIGNNKKVYQMSLLKVAIPNLPLSITTNYNQSTLKKRIIMMNTTASSIRSSWKYFVLIPILASSIICFNNVKIDASHSFSLEGENIRLYSSSNDQDCPESTPFVYPSSNEIELEIANTNSKEVVIEITDEHPFMDQSQAHFVSNKMKTSGFWKGMIKGDQVCLHLQINEDVGRYWGRSECFQKSELINLPINSEGEFRLERAAGTIVFKGEFNNKKGDGQFSFTENSNFRDVLKSEGYAHNISEELMFHMCLSDIDQDYFVLLKQEGYDGLSKKDLQSLARHNVSKKTLKESLPKYKALGYKNLSLADLVEFNIHDVSPAYITSLKEQGLTDLSQREVVQAAIHDVDANFIKEVRALGYDDLSFNDIVQFSVHDIDAKYIQSLRDQGLTDLLQHEVIQSAIHNVDADFIKEVRALGYDDLSVNDIIQFSIHDIDTKYIKSLRDQGLTDLLQHEVIQAAIHDVDADFIKEVRALGYDDLDFNAIVQFSIHDIDAKFIQSLRDQGLTDLSQHEVVQAAIHDVDGDFIKEVRALGYDDLDMNDIVQFSIHNIDAKFIKSLRDQGLTDLSQHEVIQAAIHDVDGDFIKEVRALGYDDLDMNDIVQFSIHNVDAKFIQSLRDQGLTDLSQNEVVQAAIHDVDANYIKEVRALGIANLHFNDIVQFSIHHINARFIKQFYDAGYQELSPNDLIQLAIHDVDVDFIKDLNELGFKEIPVPQLIQLNIHDVDARFIRRAQKNGHTGLSLEEYRDLKLHNFD